MINWTLPINQNSPLNKGLLLWYLTTPNRMGGLSWKDLTNYAPGELTNMSNSAWKNIHNRPGGWGSIEFDNVDDFVNISNKAKFSNLTGLTLMFWIYRIGTDLGCILSKDDGGATNGDWWVNIRDNSGHEIQFCKQYSSTNLRRGTRNGVPAADVWNHVAIVWDGSQSATGVRIFTNGMENTYSVTTDGVGTQTDLSQDLKIGQGRTGSPTTGSEGNMNCRFDDFNLWGRVLSDGEILEAYHDSRIGYPKRLNEIKQHKYSHSASVASTYEQFANRSVEFQTVDALTLTTTVFNVNTVFPGLPNVRIRISDEIMLVTSINGNTLTVLRAQEGTLADTHAAGSNVNHYITAGAMDAFRRDNAAALPHDDIPTSHSRNGMLLFPDEAPYIMRHDGSNWEYWGPVWKMFPPKVSDFSWVNQGSTTTDETSGGVRLIPPVDGSLQLRCLVKTAPSTPYTVEAKFSLKEDFSEFWGAGILVRDSSDGKIVTWGPFYRDSQGEPRGDLVKWNSATSFNASYFTFISNLFMMPKMFSHDLWWRFHDNGTDRLYQYSTDGYNYLTFDTRGRTDFVATPNQIGFYVMLGHASIASQVVFQSWRVF